LWFLHFLFASKTKIARKKSRKIIWVWKIFGKPFSQMRIFWPIKEKLKHKSHRIKPKSKKIRFPTFFLNNSKKIAGWQSKMTFFYSFSANWKWCLKCTKPEMRTIPRFFCKSENKNPQKNQKIIFWTWKIFGKIPPSFIFTGVSIIQISNYLRIERSPNGVSIPPIFF